MTLFLRYSYRQSIPHLSKTNDMAADVNRILDIHTHRTDCLDESVYNCRLRAEGADHYDKPFRSVAAPLLESPSGSQVRYQEPSHSIEPDLSEGSCDSPYSSDALSRSIESEIGRASCRERVEFS